MITGIDAITYSTDQWDEARQFLNDWGLQELAFSSTEQCFETLSGAQVIVRRPSDATLAPAMEAGPTLREVVWGVDSDADLDLLAKGLLTNNISNINPIEFDNSNHHGTHVARA